MPTSSVESQKGPLPASLEHDPLEPAPRALGKPMVWRSGPENDKLKELTKSLHGLGGSPDADSSS